MPRIKSDQVVIWAAVSPEGKIVISSISAYYSVAYRWAMKYRNHEVRKVDEIDRTVDDSALTRSEIRALPQPEEHEEDEPEAIKMPRSNGRRTRTRRAATQ